MDTFEVGAEVISVNRTSLGLTPGQDISFESFTYDRESPGCKGMVGPMSPLALSSGWCGYVYLNAWSINPDSQSVHLELAAQGGSLIEEPSQQCEAKKSLPGSDYCTWAPEYQCWKNGWPSCCFSEDVQCPQQQPACDVDSQSTSSQPSLLGSDYCTWSPDKSCWKLGWPSCCFSEQAQCPQEQPACNVGSQSTINKSSSPTPNARKQVLGAASPTQKISTEKRPGYCQFAPDYQCYEHGWPDCCSKDSGLPCPTTQPQCNLAPAKKTAYCSYAPDYQCWTQGWPDCCLDDSPNTVCPRTQPQCSKPVGSDYCTYAKDEGHCYKLGWPKCCLNSNEDCPVQQPACDVTPPGGRMLRGFMN